MKTVSQIIQKGRKLTRQGKLEAPLVADVGLSANYNCEIIGLNPIETYPTLVSASCLKWEGLWL